MGRGIWESGLGAILSRILRDGYTSAAFLRYSPLELRNEILHWELFRLK
jgi:hypothetical protein